MDDLEVNKRLKYLISEVYKITPFAFSKKYNDNRGVKTNQIINERNGVSNKMLDAICKAYPEINRTWLLTGEGKMLKSAAPVKSPESDTDPIDTTISQLTSQIARLTEKIEELNKKTN